MTKKLKLKKDRKRTKKRCHHTSIDIQRLLTVHGVLLWLHTATQIRHRESQAILPVRAQKGHFLALGENLLRSLSVLGNCTTHMEKHVRNNVFPVIPKIPQLHSRLRSLPEPRLSSHNARQLHLENRPRCVPRSRQPAHEVLPNT